MTAVPEAEGADPVAGKVVRSVSLGVLHRNDRYPHLYWQNFLSLDPIRGLSADVVIAEADRLFAELPIRHVVVEDAEAAEQLRPGSRVRVTGGGTRIHGAAAAIRSRAPGR